jgi:hypothetical protein
VKAGYTQIEAQALVRHVVEAQQSLGRVSRHTRGRVIAALDAGDHWNVLIEWDLPHWPEQQWYDRHDVQQSIKILPASSDPESAENREDTVEIRSSHDLTARSADARRTGRHLYQVTRAELQLLLDFWKDGKAQRSEPFRLSTLSREQIWITSGESRRMAAAVRRGATRITVD